MSSSGFDLERFVQAQEHDYAAALTELKAGHKRGHWIWFVFPQLRGLGRSATAGSYAISGLQEARAYLSHPLLGPRLHECIGALLVHARQPPELILGELDALKFRSCLTLFAQACPDDPLFVAALQQFYAGQPDPLTLELLKQNVGP